VDIPLAACPFGKVIFKGRVTTRGTIDGCKRRAGKRRSTEVGMQQHTSCVYYSPQGWSGLTFKEGFERIEKLRVGWYFSHILQVLAQVILKLADG